MKEKQTVVNIEKKLDKITRYYTPGIIAQMNDYHFKLCKFKSEFVWHQHDETDEVFIVLKEK